MYLVNTKYTEYYSCQIPYTTASLLSQEDKNTDEYTSTAP